MNAGVLTYSVDLDYINVNSITPFISFLQGLVDKEEEKNKKREDERTQREILKKKRKSVSLKTLEDVVFVNDDDSEPETQVENPSLKQSEHKELSMMTRAELSALCKAKGLKFTTKTSKDDLIKLLSV